MRMLASAVMPATAQIMLLFEEGRSVGSGERMGSNGDHVLVQDVQLLGRCVLLKQLAGDFSFGGKDDAVLGEDA
jgi:hypothetical protein